jgi:UDP-glucose 4-epimerase
VLVFDRNPSTYVQPRQMMTGDILDQAAVQAAVEKADVVYNFAGLADIDAASEQPLETVRSNILGNCIILEACRVAAVKRYVFASTVYVYSQAGSFYTASKQACEAYVEQYQRTYGLEYTVLRYGSLYGPRTDARNGVFRLLQQALTEQRIVYWGDGEEIREYIHVEDAARCSVDILGDEFCNQHIIISGYQQMRVRDLLTMIREMLGNRITIEYRPEAFPALKRVHYTVTPYSFAPKTGHKLLARHYIDMGQGILGCLDDLHRRLAAHSS